MFKVAVIQTAFPGDVILSSAIFEALKKQQPCETTAVIRPESECLLKDNPDVNHIVVYDKYEDDKGIKGIKRIAGELKGIDRAMVVQRHFRSTLIPYLARIPERIGYDNATASFLFTKTIKYRQDKHEVERCLDLLGAADFSSQFMPRIYLDESKIGYANQILSDNRIKSNFAVIAPGSVWPTKRYPAYSKVIDLLYQKGSLPTILLGGREDISLSSSISEHANHKPIDLTGQTDLLESAAIMARASIVISNDSAPAHLAAAMNTPVIAIFGPTSPAFGFAPYSPKSAVVDVEKLYCRPCTRHGSKRCPERHFECMINLGPGKIIEAVESLLA